MSRARWNGTLRVHRPDPSHRVFCYCSCKQDVEERFSGQQFCQMKRDEQMNCPDQLKWTTLKFPVGLNRKSPFHLISN